MDYNTFFDVLETRKKNDPNDMSYIFLQDGETERELLTYDELWNKVTAVGGYLQLFCQPGERAVLLYPSGIDFIVAFLGCMVAGVIAVPAFPPPKNQKISRLHSILEDSSPSVILTLSSLHSRISDMFVNSDKDIRCIASDTIDDAHGADWRRPNIGPDTLAFLQYTSGSTGTPKGVMVSHRNILHNEAAICRAFKNSKESVGVGWLPLYHDMGLIGHVLQPLYTGFPSVIMSPVSFLQKPVRWLQAMSKYRATASGGPNFAFNVCTQKVTEEDKTSLNLESWVVAFNGAEMIRKETMEKFSRHFESCGFKRQSFYPCYGMAETTLFTTGTFIENSALPSLSVKRCQLQQDTIVQTTTNDEESQCVVSCGASFEDTDVRIVHPVTFQDCADDRVGEIWISGPSVAQGYWNRETETKKVFRAKMADNVDIPYLRTGDLGFRHNNELFVTGRCKELIIIRGRNYYPHDIEDTVEKCHPALRPNCCAACSIEIAGKEKLLIVQEVQRTYIRKLKPEKVIGAIRNAIVSEHGIMDIHAVVLIKTGSIPKTSSGKIQRWLCHDQFVGGKLKVLGTDQASNRDTHVTSGPRHLGISTDSEASMALISKMNQLIKDGSYTQGNNLNITALECQEWLKRELASQLSISAELIDLDKRFDNYGVDSIVAIGIAGSAQKAFDVELSLELLARYPTVRLLSEYISNECKRSFMPEDNHTWNTQNEFVKQEISEHFYRIDMWPEVKELNERINEFDQHWNPFFKTHEGIASATTRIENNTLINFSSYNYLGMSGDKFVSDAAIKAIEQYGTSVSASRVVSGEKQLHRELENEIAQFIGTEDSMTYVGGHATNVSTIGHLFGKKDLILHDILSHNSIVEGCRLSGATIRPFPHNDWQALDNLLIENRRNYQKVLIALEGVYSADGDIAPLPDFVEIKKRHNALMMVDEAHSIGTIGTHGRGIGEHFNIDPEDVDIWMGTLSKSFASCGGYVAGSHALIEYLKYSSPGFVFSVGMPPSCAAAALAAIQVLRKEPERVDVLKKRSSLFLKLSRQHRLDTGLSEGSPIIPVIIGNSAHTVAVSRALYTNGISVSPMIYPSVPENAARLRFFLNCNHSEEQIRRTVELTASEVLATEADQRERNCG